MADWTFIDDYGASYPSLGGSILSLLAFSDHTLTGATFSGTLDVAASGAALATLGQVLSLTSIPVTGTVTDTNGTLNIALTSCDASAILQGIQQSIPLIGDKVTQSTLIINTIVNTTDDPTAAPPIDVIELSIAFTVGSHSVQVTSDVPMNGGFISVTGLFTNVGITLDDIDFLMGGSGNGNSWFPSTGLGPYAQGSPALDLLEVALTLYVTESPFDIAVNSVMASVGITDIALMGQALYLNPLAVVVLAISPTISPSFYWSLEGQLVLCNYQTPGNTTTPDFTFDIEMDLSDFSLSGQYGNPSDLPVSTMIQDLMGEGTDFGIPDDLTINQCEFYAQADQSTGTISAFSTSIALSGGFGLFANIEIQSIALSVEYSA
jgi:hypothetical protein